jgi:hypothetical protein
MLRANEALTIFFLLQNKNKGCDLRRRWRIERRSYNRKCDEDEWNEWKKFAYYNFLNDKFVNFLKTNFLLQLYF